MAKILVVDDDPRNLRLAAAAPANKEFLASLAALLEDRNK